MDLTQMIVALVGIAGGFGVIHEVMVTIRTRIRARSQPEYLLGQAFARGEIDEADYVDRLTVLQEVRQIERGR
jgi:hypothetical protein